MTNAPEKGQFCEEHWSWLCQGGQGKCQKDQAAPARVPRYSDVCTEGVTRKGELVPCEKTAVAVRIDPEEGDWYAVCSHHSRADMVPLSTLLVAFARGWDARPQVVTK